jgi:hypothetical protein
MLEPGWAESHTNAPDPTGFVLHLSVAWKAFGETSIA